MATFISRHFYYGNRLHSQKGIYVDPNLENSPTAEKLDEVLNCSAFDDIENAQGELEEIELPKGFGRD